MSDIDKDWKDNKKRDLEWATQGAMYAKSLRKSNSFSESINVCETILSVFPNFRKAIHQYGWSLYGEFIKKPNDREKHDPKSKHEIAKKITSMFAFMEPYTPYIMTCLSSAEQYLLDGDYDEAMEWLSKLDESGLSKDELEYQSRDGLMYWSQLRKYLELKAKYSESIKNLEESTRTWLRLLYECRNSPSQVRDIMEYNIYNNLHLLYSDDAYEEDLVDLLLIKRGFTNTPVRKKYKAMLERLFKKYDGWQGDQPVFSADQDAIVLQLAKELLISSRLDLKPKVKSEKKRQISATALSNFTFCTASYPLQETYDFGSTELGNIGTMMHDKQLLLSRKMEENKKEFYLFSTKQKPNYFESLELDDEIKRSISPLIDDISTSKLIFHGHNKDEVKLFHDDTGTLVGSPDYIFEKSDGTRFVIEEKFSFQKLRTKPRFEPYSNHLVQLGTYTTLLNEIQASYGYILYWSYSFEDKTPCVSKAQAFRVDNSDEFETKIYSVVNELKTLNSSGETDFDINTLNPWKCVNCVTTDRCMHKTGNRSTLTLPYT